MVFDEPTNGLDPTGIAEIRALIKKISKEGKTIIMASHMLDEVEKVCTHVAILKKGELLANGHVDEILANDDVIETGSDNPAQLPAVLSNMPGHRGVFGHEDGKITIHFAQGAANLAAVNKHCFEKGITLNHLLLKRKSLEAKFMELTGA
jgi:ABC-2 type transport system ATP-binding protein